MHLFGCKQTPPTPPTTSDEESSGSTDDGDMKKKKGNRAMGKKKYPKAVKYYTRAVKIDPENPTYRMNRAIANAALELWKDAEEDAAGALDLGGTQAKLHFQLARARLKRGNCEGAAFAVEAGLKAFPSEASLLQLQKEISRSKAQRDAKDARRRERESAVKPAGPASAKALLQQARDAYTANKLEEAVRLLRTAREAVADLETTEARRDEISICSLLGRTLMRQRLWLEAVEPYQRMVALMETTYSMENPQEREALSSAYNNLGIAYKNANRMKEAIEVLNKAYMETVRGDEAIDSPGAAQVLQNIAQCLVKEGKIEEARKMFSRALEIGQRLHRLDHASNAVNHMCIARCFKKEQKLGEAMQSFTKAYEILTQKDIEEVMQEMPEAPSKQRVQQIQEECRRELAELILVAEKLQGLQAEAAASGQAGPGGAAERPPTGAAAEAAA